MTVGRSFARPTGMLAALRKVPRLYVVLGLVAFLAYLPGSWWGAPTATAPDRKLSWGTDDETPLGVDYQARATIVVFGHT